MINVDPEDVRKLLAYADYSRNRQPNGHLGPFPVSSAARLCCAIGDHSFGIAHKLCRRQECDVENPEYKPGVLYEILNALNVRAELDTHIASASELASIIYEELDARRCHIVYNG